MGQDKQPQLLFQDEGKNTGVAVWDGIQHHVRVRIITSTMLWFLLQTELHFEA